MCKNNCLWRDYSNNDSYNNSTAYLLTEDYFIVLNFSLKCCLLFCCFIVSACLNADDKPL